MIVCSLSRACVIVGGFGSYLLGLNRRTYEQAGVGTEGNNPGSTKEPGIGWMTAFLFVTSFVGLLALVPIRKVFHFSSELYHVIGCSNFAIIYVLLFSNLQYK